MFHAGHPFSAHQIAPTARHLRPDSADNQSYDANWSDHAGRRWRRNSPRRGPREYAKCLWPRRYVRSNSKHRTRSSPIWWGAQWQSGLVAQRSDDSIRCHDHEQHGHSASDSAKHLNLRHRRHHTGCRNGYIDRRCYIPPSGANVTTMQQPSIPIEIDWRRDPRVQIGGQTIVIEAADERSIVYRIE
jgi:hypothetical protein